MSMRTIKNALKHGPLSMVELAQALDQGRTVITRPLRKLRDRKEVHVAHYERQPEGYGGAFIPFYALGDKQDARTPAPIPRVERDRAYRRRHKARISAKRSPHYHTSMGVWAGLGGRA